MRVAMFELPLSCLAATAAPPARHTEPRCTATHRTGPLRHCATPRSNALLSTAPHACFYRAAMCLSLNERLEIAKLFARHGVTTKQGHPRFMIMICCWFRNIGDESYE